MTRRKVYFFGFDISTLNIIFIMAFLGVIKTIQFLTRFAPFSHLFRDKLYHHDNRHLHRLVSLSEDIALNHLKRPFRVLSADRDEYFHTLFGKFTGRKKGSDILPRLREQLAHMLGVDTDTIFADLREDGYVRISVPNEIAVA